MRVYSDCYELMSEILREVYEMGHIVHPNSMQNKDVKGNDDFSAKEIINYSYCLTSLSKPEYLFIMDPEAKKWANAEFLERVSTKSIRPINPGKAWELRKGIWEQFLNDEGKFDYTYNERIDPSVKLPLIVNELKANPDSRQCVLSIWDSDDLYFIGGERRVPCSIYYHFLIRSGSLHIIYNQRSADVVTHFGNDVYLASQLQAYVAYLVGVKVGNLFHNITSLHSYKKDWGILKQSITDIRNARL